MWDCTALSQNGGYIPDLPLTWQSPSCSAQGSQPCSVLPLWVLGPAACRGHPL